MKVHAKINLSLNVTGKAGNGFHCLDMVMASVNISDAVSVTRRRDSGVTVVMRDASGAVVPLIPQKNTAYRAAISLVQGLSLPGCDIEIEKGIPFAAGLGGSSADAAAVITAMGRLYGLDIHSSSAYIIAFKSGSDVPYMLDGGYARVYGMGEKVHLLPVEKRLHLVIAKGLECCSSGEVYRKFDSLPPRPIGSADAMIEALQSGTLEAVAANLHNDLQTPAIALCPEITETLALIKSTRPIGLQMSGSGPACFGIYPDAAAARAACDAIKDRLSFCETAETVLSGFAQ